MSVKNRMIGINWRTGMGVLAEDDQIVLFNHSESRCTHDDNDLSKCWWVDGEWMTGQVAMRLIAGSDPISDWRKFAVEVWLTMPEEMQDAIYEIGQSTHPEHDIVILNLIQIDPSDNSRGGMN